MSESFDAYVASIILTALSILIGALRYLPIDLIDRPRNKFLVSLSLVNQNVRNFTDLISNPEKFFVKQPSIKKKLFEGVVLVMNVLTVGLLFFWILFFIIGANNAPIWLLTVLIALFFLDETLLFTLSRLTSALSSTSPQRSWLVVCFYARSITGYVVVAIVVFGIGFLTDFSSLSSILTLIGIIFGGVFVFLIYMNRRQKFRKIENELFEKTFRLHQPLVEITLKHSPVPVVGFVTGIGDSLILKQHGGLTRVIEWNDILTVAERQDIPLAW